MIRAELDALLESRDESLLLADGFDDAFIGVSDRMNEPLLAVYSYDKMVEVLKSRDGMTDEEACEYIDFNVVGAWVGDRTPIWVTSY